MPKYPELYREEVIVKVYDVRSIELLYIDMNSQNHPFRILPQFDISGFISIIITGSIVFHCVRLETVFIVVSFFSTKYIEK